MSAPEVLAASAPIIVAAGCEFKFAHSRTALRQFNDTRVPRGMSGKFITIYPVDDDQFRELAALLDAATDGLAGPRILSDARLRPGSLVHYRYGAFRGIALLDNDGSYSYRIVGPDGDPVPDLREAYFVKPAWVDSPLEQPSPPPAPSADAPKEVLLNERYRVSTAIRHANKGGVYLAEDTRTGATVIIKEGRPHVATDDSGRDSRDVIAHEAAVLRRLQPLGWTPALVDEFAAQDHAFLVQEKVDGVPLSRWVHDRLDDGELYSVSRWWELARGLTRMVEQIHAAGIILRDLNPNNVMVAPDGQLRLIDLELAHPAGEPDPIYAEGGTPGFSAPEQFRAVTPDVSADVYSLGATLLYTATGMSVEVPDDERPLGELNAQRMRTPRLPFGLPTGMVEIIEPLLREEPGQRPRLADALAPGEPAPGELWREPTADEACQQLREFSATHFDELVDGIIGHLAQTLNPEGELRVWRGTGFGEDTEPCAVQYGAGGTLAVLSQLHQIRPQTTVEELLGTVHDRIVKHLKAAEHRLPGLYFGASGTALAVHAAGRALGRDESVELADKLLRDLPRVWPNPDITHGASGIGTALLLHWRETGDPSLLELVAEVADGLLAAADAGDAAIWTIPGDFDSKLAGYASYGFAHGTAGVGAFLLDAGVVLDRPDLRAAARRCARTLEEVADHRGPATVWHEGPGKSGFLTHWCNGSSGVGTFLIRMFAAEGDPRHLELSHRAALSIMVRRWRSGTAYCHGLAGDADFVLDLAQAGADPIHHAWARELARTLHDRRILRDGNLVLPNETGQAITAEFGSGLAGHLAFLLRLRHGGQRLFHPHLAAHQ